ncbi:hypothetical protein ACIQAC_33670 [Streptomyces sp. NPDC088387]|uniref:hypothetical protein n=1 Tax=Streptomyces sp. NPDC088387 TaxID=3365859 RepID=UPI0038203AA1
MHRTTTTAALLVTVAVSALAGCTTVPRPAAPSAPPTTPTQVPAPRPDGRAEPQIVQAPAREALEMIGPSQHPERKPAATRRPAPSPSADAKAAGTPGPRSAPRRRAERPERPASRPPRQSAQVPDLTGPVGGAVPPNTDVCDLGRKYGGWRQDSQEARICEQTYGR